MNTYSDNDMLREIEPSMIVETAMGIVSSATESIQVTMEAAEELAQPLPRDYFALLQKKLSEGITVTRIGFGSAEEFSKLKHIHFTDPLYAFHASSGTDYRRMLLVDDSKMLFVRSDETGRHVFLTDEKNTIEEYRRFFENHLID